MVHSNAHFFVLQYLYENDRMSTSNDNIRTRKQLDQIASHIKELRLNENFTQAEVAKALNVHRNTIIRIENGKPFSTLLLLQFANLYDIDLSQLFIDMP